MAFFNEIGLYVNKISARRDIAPIAAFARDRLKTLLPANRLHSIFIKSTFDEVPALLTVLNEKNIIRLVEGLNSKYQGKFVDRFPPERFSVLSPDTRRKIYRALDAVNLIHILNRYQLDHKGIEELIGSIPSVKLGELLNRAYWGNLSEIFVALYKQGRTGDLLFKVVKLAVGAENPGKEKAEKLANAMEIIEDKNAARVIARLIAKFRAA